MARMLGKRVNTTMPWSQCDCGCRASAVGRKTERRIQKKRDKAQWKKEVGAW